MTPRASRWLIVAAMAAAMALTSVPASAAPTGASVTIAAGSGRSVTINTAGEQDKPQPLCPAFPGSVGGFTYSGGTQWTTFVQVNSTTPPGTYSCTIASPNPAGTAEIVVNVVPPTTTTTTTTQPPPTTTTRPTTTTTTTTEPPTTTTEPPTTTTAPTTTTTSSTTTSTLAPPPTIDDGRQGPVPLGWFIGGAAALAALLGMAAIVGMRRQRVPGYRPAPAGPAFGLRQWLARRSLDRRSRGGSWRTRRHGPAWWQDWRSARHDEREVRRRIEERRRRR